MGTTFDPRRREAARLAELNRLGAMESEADSVLQELVDDARGVFGTGFCMVNLVTADAQHFRAWSGEMPSAVEGVRSNPRGKSMCRYVVEHERPIVVEDFSTTELFKEQHLSMGPDVLFYAGTPLKTSGGHAVGSLCVMDDRPREFGDRDMATLRAYGRAVVGRLEALGAAAQEREAKESERQYRRNVFELANDAILIYGSETGRILDANRRACEMYGIPREMLVGKKVVELSSEREVEEEHTREVLRRGLHRGFETVHRRADGSRMQVSINSSVTDYGGQRAILSIVRDVTERRRTEEALRKSEKSLAQAQRIAHIGNWEYELGKNRTLWSDEMYRIFGFAPRTLSPAYRTFMLFVHPDDKKRVRKSVRAALYGNGPEDVEYRIVRPDGEVRSVCTQYEAVYDGTGRPLTFFGTLQDVTEQNEAEQKLREAEHKYRFLVEEIPVVAYIDRADVPDAASYTSPRIEALLGYTPEEWLDGRLWLERLHPDDRDWVLKADTRARAAEEPFGEEYRLIARDGSVVWVRDESALLRDEAGRPLLWQGVLLDVTGRKEAEEALRRNEERFRSLIQNAPDMIMVLDADNNILYDSPSVQRVLGYEPGERLGSKGFDYVHPEDLAQAEHTFVEVLSNPSIESPVEYRLRHKDGSWRHFEATRTNLLDDPAVGGIVINCRDITERKRWEEKVRAAEEKYRRLVETIPAITYVSELDGKSTPFYLSPQYESVFGFTVEERISTPDLWVECLHPDDRGRVLAANNLSNKTGEPFDEEYRVVTRDGREIWMHDASVVLRDAQGRLSYRQGVMYDVTGRKRAEERIGFQAQLLEQVQTAIIATDMSGTVTHWNAHAERVYGWSREEALGRKARALVVGPRDSRVAEEIMEKLWAGESWEGEFTVQHKDGSTFPVFVTDSLVRDTEGRVVGFVGASTDISERKKVEEALYAWELRMRTVIEQSPLGIHIFAPDGTSLLANDAWDELWYLDAEEAAQPANVFEDELIRDAGLIRHIERSVAENVPVIAPLLLFDPASVGREGRSRWLRALIYPVKDEDGRALETALLLEDFTERKRAEDALRESEKRYRAVIERTTDGIFLADFTTRRILKTNPALQNMLGYAPEELVGMPIYDVIAEERGSVDRKSQRILDERSLLIGERHYRRKDGSLVDVESSATTIPYGDREVSCCIARNITTRKRAQEALGESEERYRAVVEQSAEAIWLFDPDSKRVLEANAAFQEMLGYDAEELRGMTNYDFVAHSREDVDSAVERKLRGEENPRSERKYRRKDGTLLDVEVGGAMISYRGKRVVCSMARDVTERKRVEEEVKEANRRLEELATLRADFTAMVAHELDTPLAVIRGYADVLATGELGPEYSERALSKIQAETEVLNALVKDVRVAASAERRDFVVNPRKVPVDELLDDAARFAVTLPGNHLLELERSSDAPPWYEGVRAGYADPFFPDGAAGGQEVWADRYRIGQVLRNLLTNAAKYSPEGAPVRLRVLPAETPGRLRIEVADRGPGIHPDEVERIFEKFGRGRGSGGQKATGLGLGLYLSRRILRAHGSELTINPRSGGGSVFTFELEAADE